MAHTPDPDGGDTHEPTADSGGADEEKAEDTRRIDLVTDGTTDPNDGTADPAERGTSDVANDDPSADPAAGSTLVDRRDYMRVLGGAAAAAAGLGALTGSGAAAEYETITVDAGGSYTANLGSGDTLENVLIDVTADGADVHIGADGDGWVIRNVGIRGAIDIGDDSPGGDDPSYEGGYNSVFTVDASSGGSGLIENVYLGDGIEPGVDKSALITATNHDGHIDVRNFNCGGFSTTAFYVSGFGRERTGGTMTIEDSYFANSAGTAHIRPAGNVTIRNCTITNTNEAVYIPRTFGGLDQAMTARGIWTSYSGSTTRVENCDIDVREENTCDAPWDYDGPCQATSVWAGEAPIDLVDSEVRGTVGGNVNQSNVGSAPDLSLPSGVPDSAEVAASGGTASGSDDSTSGDSGNGSGGSAGNVIEIAGGSPTNAVTYTFEVTETVELGSQANDEDSVSGTTAAGVLAGGTDSFTYTGEIADFSASGTVSVLIDGSTVDPATLASDGDYLDDDSTDGSGDETTDSQTLSRSITVSGGMPSDVVEYSFSVSEAVALGDLANSEDEVSGTDASGVLAGGSDSYSFAGEITSFQADGVVGVLVDGETVDPETLGDSTDGSTSEPTSEPTETIALSGGSPSDPDSYAFAVDEVVEKGEDANSEDTVSGTTADGVLAGGTDDYVFASTVTSFEATGDVAVTINGEAVDPAQLGDDGSSGTDDGTDDTTEEPPEPTRSLAVSGGSPSNKIDYSLTVTEVVEEGSNANSEDSASGTSASGVVAGGTDDYAFAGELVSFDATGDVTLTVDGETVDPANYSDSTEQTSTDEPPELTETLVVSGGTFANVVDYSFTVTEAVETGEQANSEDSASGTTASGALAGGSDSYEFAGDLVSFEADGDVTLTVNGETVDPATLG
ncbi:hypothetical protein L593_05075 [Salinarchaeum sp. Harcht-Bsk1]|uniref:right-handed parallel beta-helix repeat-containing protein n=1 Tax=Salinarchaeum sp. Harcht-Bsk1 TaxID=1333523 RepID=UPI00034241D4|nr:right-handed parallel beta-helix repeat-containing protein [Salinarchaeum sp. Harcht-Bsk1]AGN00964.1 hypothetical protein L593_05075 [Salinarchaeum sp. Harcht-Bsk1]